MLFINAINTFLGDISIYTIYWCFEYIFSIFFYFLTILY